MERLASLEAGLEEERSKSAGLETALADERTKTRELAEAPSAFEGQVEAAKKTETALHSEIASLRQQLTETGFETVKQCLDEAEAALEAERAKGEQITRDASGIPRSFYLGAAAVALLVGTGGWMSGQGRSSSDIEQLSLQNQELVEQLRESQSAVAALQASASTDQAGEDKVAELTEQVELLSAELADSREALAAAEENARQELEKVLAEIKGAPADQNEAAGSGKSFRDCSKCPEMVVIPAGSFLMGSPDGEEGRRNSEGPQHRVTIGAPFALGKYEVTFDEWDACVAAGGCDHKPNDRGWGRGSRPVINVSWEDAQQYVAWLSEETSETYRMPSEAEWEYAARAGTTTRYFWGDGEDFTCDSANVYDQVGEAANAIDTISFECDDGFAQTAPAGSFRANAFGLHDVSGNVWEWGEDSWHDSYDGARADGSVWVEGKDSVRVVRGGAWNDDPWILRSAYRGWFGPGNRTDILGFRVSRTLTP